MATRCLRPGWPLVSTLALLAATCAAACGDEPEERASDLDPRGVCPEDWRAYPFAPAGTAIRFPADEGAHYTSDPAVTMEWWYTIYHLTAADGRQLSVMLTFFMPQFGGAYRPFNVTDVASGEMHESGEWGTLQAGEGAIDLVWRGPPGTGAESTFRHRRDARGAPLPFAYEQHAHYVDPRHPERHHSLHLRVDALKPPLIVGGDGYVTIGDSGESYYYSLTRLAAEGELVLDGETLAVSGFGWLDHQWGPFILSPIAVLSRNSYEWMALHLADGDEYMVSSIWDASNRLHREEGFGGIGWMSADCTQGLTLDYTVERLAFWQAGVGEPFYSHRWRVVVPAKQLDVVLEPDVEDQTVPFAGTTFWEGRASIAGSAASGPIEGIAFVELVHQFARPQVELLEPAAGASVGAAVTLRWRVANPDDAMPLTHVVTAAAAGGEAQPLCEPGAALECEADLSAFAPGPLTLRVRAASIDGVLAGEATREVTRAP